MDKKNKILIVFLLVFFIVFCGFTFFETIIHKDFEIILIEPLVEE